MKVILQVSARNGESSDQCAWAQLTIEGDTNGMWSILREVGDVAREMAVETYNTVNDKQSEDA